MVPAKRHGGLTFARDLEDVTLLATSDLEGEDWVDAGGGNGCFTAMMSPIQVGGIRPAESIR
jgi:hypothetical protein